MNVVIVLDNNQNNILPYKSRFLQMPKVEIQGLFNAHITFTIDSNCSTSYCQYKIVEIFAYVIERLYLRRYSTDILLL